MILIMGVAGAGKSVQGKILAKKLDYEWLSSGELLRRNVAQSNQQDMLKGKLLDDDKLINIFDQEFSRSDTTSRIILDGFPRTLAQAEWLLDKHKDREVDIEAVILLEAPESKVRERLLHRGRPDDTKEAIAQRFVEHEKMTLPIVEMYSKNGIPVHEIDGDQTIKKVSRSIENALGRTTKN